MTYLKGYRDGLRPEDAADPETGKPIDAGGVSLPFDHLDGRRFEVLTYRLKKIEHAGTGRRIALMQGSGERGRDVVVYDSQGKVAEIVQCKNLQDRLSDAIARRELVKLALHTSLAPELLGDNGVKYELRSPAGFTEDAAQLIDTWPNGWTEESVAGVVNATIEKYAAFDGLGWEDVREFVLNTFPQLVSVLRCEGVDIAQEVRADAGVYKAFFQGHILVDPEEYAGTLQQAVTAGVAQGFAKFNDKDAIHVLDRIASFDADKRIVGSNGYVFGLSTELVSRFRRAEYAEYAKCAMQATFGITQVVQTACVRIANEVLDDLRQQITPTNLSVFHVVRKTLVMSVLAKLNGLSMTVMRDAQPGLENYRKLPPEEKLEKHVVEIWDEYSQCLAAYDSTRHPDGSNEAVRAEIGRHGLAGFGSKEDFEKSLRDDIEAFRKEINAALGRLMMLVPNDLMVITDTMTVFEKDRLFKRMQETTDEMVRLRGSDVIPE